ncbi:LysM peptidoglycan-binding domain-containing protein [Akkermansiaceae bacterium]|nr:LysM peptidoglycan-binding domain-containing protein [Akkermansiaceae bacterium]MDB4412687.1 LysM peptidoglycan-binding domain-containing protein [bacterium]MDB4668150.1 LysM peptidoglycan-binding domain-containing protein [Akkermansiaceae bacterium]MDC0265331.1 LysM peptidoglycan-binding domain-containing protein [bacterium]
MKRLLLSLLLTTWVTVTLVSCSGSKDSGYNPDVGPFDADGNYIEAWADNPPKRGTKLRKTNPKPTSQPKVKEKPAPKVTQPAPRPVTKPTPRPKPVVKPKPKPRPVVKPKPKPAPVKVKPKTVRHVVKKGDTLYSLSRKYRTTVSKIQKANGMSGTIIRDGSTLVIPR